MSRTPVNSSSRRIFRFRDPHTFDTFIQFYNEQAKEFQALGVHIKIKGKSLVIDGGPPSAISAVGEILNDLQVRAETAYKGGNAQVRSTRSSSGVRTPSSSIKKLAPKNVHQAEYIDLIKSSEIVFGLGCAGTGKTFLAVACAIQALEAGEVEKIIITRPAVEAGENLGFLPGPQPLDAKIATPFGWTTMGQIKVGDLVIGRDGMPTTVVKVIPKGVKMVYRVSTTEETSTECCEDHLWFTENAEQRKRGNKGAVRTTRQIMESLMTIKGKPNHFLPRNDAVQYSPAEPLPIPAYTLGALLGDGCFTDLVSISSNDPEIPARIQSEVAQYGCTVTKYGNNRSHYIGVGEVPSRKTARKVVVTNLSTGEEIVFASVGVAATSLSLTANVMKYRCQAESQIGGYSYKYLPLESRWVNPLKNLLSNEGLFGVHALNKFIPEKYKYASVADRLDLLRGLMDTDGTVKKTGEASFTSTSRRLALDLIEVVQSLGGRAVLRERPIRKPAKMTDGRLIQGKTVCYEFTVSMPSTLNPFYLPRKAERFASKYTVGIGIQSIEPVCEKEVQCIQVDNDEHLYLTDGFLVTHNTAEEKLDPYLTPIYDAISSLCGLAALKTWRGEGKIEIAPVAFLRGRTLSRAFVLLDEAQNCTFTQIKMLLTRIGEGSKCVITGDASQTDIGWRNSGLERMCDILDSVEEIGIYEFDKSDVVRHPLVGKIIDAIDAFEEEEESSR